MKRTKEQNLKFGKILMIVMGAILLVIGNVLFFYGYLSLPEGAHFEDAPIGFVFMFIGPFLTVGGFCMLMLGIFLRQARTYSQYSSMSAALSPIEDPDQPRKPDGSPSEMKTSFSIENAVVCPKCGTKNKKGDLYCKKCGTKIASPILCPSCGAENAPDAEYCSKCGKELKSEKEESSDAGK
jgi:ribosomal protein L40E/uncharacterized membrane protein